MYDLTEIFLLSGLKDTQKQEIIGHFPPLESFGKGEVIYNTNHYEKALGVVLSGTAAARTGDVIKRAFKSGDVFGAAAVFGDDNPYVSEIIATGNCTVQLIPESILVKLFEKYPETSLNYIKFLTRKVRFLNNKIAQFSAHSVAQKLYEYLVQSAGDSGAVTVPSMTEITRQTGIGRTSLYRCLNELESSGLIVRENNTIRVCNK